MLIYFAELIVAGLAAGALAASAIAMGWIPDTHGAARATIVSLNAVLLTIFEYVRRRRGGRHS